MIEVISQIIMDTEKFKLIAIVCIYIILAFVLVLYCILHLLTICLKSRTQRCLERPQPGIFTIRLDPPIIDQNCDDKPPSYESLTQPPKYETVKGDFFEYPSRNCE
ncbi:hypothetical protein ACKWTF_013402 [Chironomus riparius]